MTTTVDDTYTRLLLPSGSFAQHSEITNSSFLNNHSMSRNAYIGVMGTEKTFCLWGKIYYSPLYKVTKRANLSQKLGEELNALWLVTVQYMRKLDVKEGWHQPDLS